MSKESKVEGEQGKIPPQENRNREIEESKRLNKIYSNKDIKSLLKNYLPNASIENIYLFKVTEDEVTKEDMYNAVDFFKEKLISETTNKIVSSDNFYVIIGRADDQSRVSSAILLKLSNKNNENQIEILPIVGSNIGFIRDELKKVVALRKISTKVDDLPVWFRKNQKTNLYLNNLIEVIKLSIEYKAPSKVPHTKIQEIMNTPYSE